MILLIDNYDSFVFNVEQYIKELTNEEVLTVRNDKINLQQVSTLKPNKIVFSPGPKHPKDSGVCLDILKHYNQIPILGICLGHQAIGHVFGAKISQLETPLHGKTSSVYIQKTNALLKDLPQTFEAMRYHSLYIEELPSCLETSAITKDNIVMATKHKEKEIYGVQFHPESFFSEYGKKIIENFLSIGIDKKQTIEKKENTMLKKYLKKLQDDLPLDNKDFSEICDLLSTKNYDEIQLGSLLVLISEKSLYPESLTTFVKNILKYSITFSDPTPMIDVCGTGGDGFKTINISTAVAFILASMGVRVAKHGNKAVSSQSGSSDVLAQINLQMSDSMTTQKKLLQEHNLAFFHAPFFHQLVGQVKDVRARLGIRTVFNILGPLLNPNTELKYQLVGLYHAPVHRLYAETLQLLGREHALVVRGEDGLDEITICDETKIVEVKDKQILEYTITPEMFGFQRAFHSDIEGGTPQENAATLEGILKGEIKGAKRDIVVLNTMFALYTANAAESPLEAKALVEKALDGQSVYKFMQDYLTLT